MDDENIKRNVYESGVYLTPMARFCGPAGIRRAKSVRLMFAETESAVALTLIKGGASES